eukprot:Platyproteum_vivax@DN2953_c0_g1_i1.p1
MENTDEFHTGLCACGSDPKTCLLSCCCSTWMAFAARVAVVDGDDYKFLGIVELPPPVLFAEVLCFPFCSMYITRMIAVNKYGLKHSLPQAIGACCCCCLGLAQTSREIEYQRGEPINMVPCSKGGLSCGMNEGSKSSAGLMNAPGQQTMDDHRSE